MVEDDRLIYQLLKAQQKLSNYLKKKLSEKGAKITYGQAAILFLLQKRPYTMTELSQTLSIDNSATTGLIDRMEKSGLAKRKVHPKDRRTYLITITSKGTDEITKAKPIVKSVNKKIKEGFNAEEIDVYKKVIHSFFEKFEY